VNSFKAVRRNEVLIVVIIALVFSIYMHWKELSDPNRFHDNWRQVPHWINPDRQDFQADDIFIKYAEFNTSPFANFLYKNLAKLGPDILWGKINAMIFYVLAALLIFLTSRKMGNSLSGWISLIIFLLFPCIFRWYTGGFMSSLSTLLLILTCYIIFLRKWWYTPPLLLLGSLIYPMVAIHGSFILFLDHLFNDLRQTFSPHLLKKKILPILIGIILILLIVSFKYLDDNHNLGKLVSRSEMIDRPEFTSAGRSSLLPVRSLLSNFERSWRDIFHILLFLISFFFLGKNIFKLPRPLYSLLLSGILLYWLADIFLIKFYFPNRYLKFMIPIFSALAGGFWLKEVYLKISVKYTSTKKTLILYSTICLVLIVSGILSFPDYLDRSKINTIRYRRHDLYSFVRGLPDSPLIAAHPKLSSEIGVLCGKSVLVSSELSHPWWPIYWKLISSRTKDLFRAYYSKDLNEIVAITDRYQIDYWIIQKHQFEMKYFRRRNYHFEPFNAWIRRDLKPSIEAAFADIPPKYSIFSTEKYIIISADSLRNWRHEKSNNHLECHR